MPWEELKKLYRESIEKKIMKNIEKNKTPQVFSFEEVLYHLKIGKKTVRGELFLSGKPIPVFDKPFMYSKMSHPIVPNKAKTIIHPAET